MAHSKSEKKLTIKMAATYRISVQGKVRAEWSDRLAEMCITETVHAGNEAPVTTLIGRLKDQAQLMGVLTGLYDLHMPLLSVELLSRDNPKRDPG